MKILHIVEDFSVASGGLRTVIKNLDFELRKKGHNSYVLSTDKENEDDIFLVKAKNKAWMYSNEWLQIVKEIVKKKNINIIHIHGVWLYPHFMAAKFAVKNNIPFVLSVHGMYEPWLWSKGTLKKKLYFNILVKKVFLKAKVIQTITPFETQNVNALFDNKVKIVEIPNLIHLPQKKTKSNKREKYILYLGRLDEKKGIKLLIESLARIKDSTVIIKIVGAFNDYKLELDQLIHQLKLTKRISFLGQVTGKEKEALIQEAFVLVAPSYSEVIGMVNLEGAIFKTPVITTYQTGLDKEWNNQGGKLINPNRIELTEALNEVLNWTTAKRNEEGKKLHDFVVKNYSWKEKIDDWIQLYNNTLMQ